MAKGSGERLFKRAANPQWYDRRDPVTGKQRSTGKTRKSDAVAVMLERELLARQLNAEAERKATDPRYAASQALVSDAINNYLDRCRERKLSEATLGMYEGKLGHWVRFLGENAYLSAVTKVSFDKFISLRRAESASSHTISKECSIFVRALWLASRDGTFFEDLDTLIPADLNPEYEPRERALTLEETIALLDKTTGKLNALVAVSAALGVRRSEAVKLTPEDIDFENGFVLIRGTKTKKSLRTVPILSLFRGLLEAALPLLPIGPKVPNNIYRGLDVACRHAKIEYCTPNDLRRSHATILLEHEVSPDVVRRLLGHTSEAMLRRVYGKTRPTVLAVQAEGAIRRSTNAATANAGQDSPESEGDVSLGNQAAVSETSAERVLNTRLPKPKVADSNSAGGAASTSFFHDDAAQTQHIAIPAIVALVHCAAFLGVLPANDTHRKAVGS